MTHNPCDANAIVVTDGSWMHIRQTRVHHRRYPEVRGEGRSLSDAKADLLSQLTRALDGSQGRRRAEIGRALDEVRAHRLTRSGPRPLVSAP